MKKAIQEAIIGMKNNEVPIGGVMVFNNKILAKSHNTTQSLKNVTYHAEMRLISLTSLLIGDKYLNNCIMYVTIEPCVMCAGALFWCQIKKLVFGARNKKNGFLKQNISLHKNTKICKGILKNECKQLITQFFIQKRQKYIIN